MDFSLDFHIIYDENHNASLQLVEAITERFEDGYGYKGYYADRDLLPGSNIFDELFTIVEKAKFTFVLFTPEFIRNTWSRYCHQAALKTLLDNPYAGVKRFIPLSLGCHRSELPRELVLNSVLVFQDNWREDEWSWLKLTRVVQEDLTVTEVQQEQVGSSGSNSPPALQLRHRFEVLTDKRLYDLASNHLGRDWYGLGIQLDIPSTQLDQMKQDNPGDTPKQIFTMLRSWRDRERGTERKRFTTLLTALSGVGRNDVVEVLTPLLQGEPGSASGSVGSSQITAADININHSSHVHIGNVIHVNNVASSDEARQLSPDLDMGSAERMLEPQAFDQPILETEPGQGAMIPQQPYQATGVIESSAVSSPKFMQPIRVTAPGENALIHQTPQPMDVNRFVPESSPQYLQAIRETEPGQGAILRQPPYPTGMHESAAENSPQSMPPVQVSSLQSMVSVDGPGQCDDVIDDVDGAIHSLCDGSVSSSDSGLSLTSNTEVKQTDSNEYITQNAVTRVKEMAGSSYTPVKQTLGTPPGERHGDNSATREDSLVKETTVERIAGEQASNQSNFAEHPTVAQTHVASVDGTRSSIDSNDISLPPNGQTPEADRGTSKVTVPPVRRMGISRFLSHTAITFTSNLFGVEDSRSFFGNN